MSARRKHQDTSALGTVLIIIILAIIGFTCWFVAESKHAADAQLARTNATSQKVKPAAAKTNIVAGQSFGSSDLVSFLKADDTGCWRQPSQGDGWFRIMKEVNGSQAELEYGCSNDYDQGAGAPARMLVQKVTDKWQIISPTNQWIGPIPSCTMVNDNNILTELEPECWLKQSESGTTVISTHNSQYATSYATCLTAPGSTVTKTWPYLCVTKDDAIFTK